MLVTAAFKAGPTVGIIAAILSNSFWLRFKDLQRNLAGFQRLLLECNQFVRSARRISFAPRVAWTLACLSLGVIRIDAQNSVGTCYFEG
jgi:hypothetical protein